MQLEFRKITPVGPAQPISEIQSLRTIGQLDLKLPRKEFFYRRQTDSACNQYTSRAEEQFNVGKENIIFTNLETIAFDA